MKVQFCGAARTVTGSMHLVTLQDGRRLLLDCGLFQGRRKEADQINREFAFDPASLDAVLLSHAHIDHSGNLPNLWKQGFRGKVWCTHATRSLCELMLKDSAFIQEKDIEFVNKRRRRKGQAPKQPLYKLADAEGVLEHFIGVSYRGPFEPLPGVSVEYRDAGHILGSATMVLTVQEEGQTKRLGFTGDVGRPDRPILRDPQPMPECDWLISESTYGGETHPHSQSAKELLADVIRRTCRRGGKVIIPAFAVGRTQEIVYGLNQLWNAGRLPRVPVFVDSPLAVNVTSVYRTHPECYDQKLLDLLLDDDDPFGFRCLRYVRKVEQSKALNAMHVPMVVISASGMCEAGRVLHHLRNNIEDPRTCILIVGYNAPNTLGRRLVERQPRVRIFGESFNRRAEVEVINSYSAHADQPELLDFLSSHDPARLKKLFLVHGDYDRQQVLAKALKQNGFRHITIPSRLDQTEL
ncbi:MAG TPA: MBL fold metallo-hydrolase [Acidobacteriota bacterium]|nr:MBL fold metallo-hydrolase [Acidobacteriota bacterium]